MTKTRSPIATAQIAFTFDAPPPASYPADLAGLDGNIAAAVGRILKEDVRSRDEIAGRMSSLLDTPVSRAMLDAYASEARDGHNISAGRLFTLISATNRFDVLDALLTKIGARVLFGEEILAAHLGHLKLRRTQLDGEIKAIERCATPIGRANK